MTDWKEQARKHEESANEYARMNYELEAINTDLLEALNCIAFMGTDAPAVTMDVAGFYESQLYSCIQIAARTLTAITKAEETQ